jgi:DNA-binding transcriptional LysR family regulator
MDHLRSMRAFVSVADFGSFGRAADSMVLSKAAISRLVAHLEARLGTRLLNRTTRRISLTEAGRFYLERARQILVELQDLEQSVTTGNVEPNGRLRIAASVSLDQEALAAALRTYIKRYPKVVPHLSLVDRAVDLADEGLDIGIAVKTAGTGTVTQSLASVRPVMCATSAYLSMHGVPMHPVELTEHSCLGISSESEDDWVFTGTGGTVRARPTQVVATNNPQMLRQLALRGMGIAILPDYLVASDVMRGDLVQVLPKYRLPLLEISASYPRHRSLNGKVRTFVDRLVEHFDRTLDEPLVSMRQDASTPTAKPAEAESGRTLDSLCEVDI